jgi:hypothetical protein
VIALPNDGGQSIAEVLVRIEGAALIENERNLAGWFVCLGPCGHRGSPQRPPCCQFIRNGPAGVLVGGRWFDISAPILSGRVLALLVNDFLKVIAHPGFVEVPDLRSPAAPPCHIVN